jgi:hypothetical protein
VTSTEYATRSASTVIRNELASLKNHMFIKHGVFLILLVVDLILSGVFLGLPGFIIPSGIQDYERNTENTLYKIATGFAVCAISLVTLILCVPLGSIIRKQQERLLITLVLKIVNIFALDFVIISEVQGAAATYQIVCIFLRVVEIGVIFYLIWSLSKFKDQIERLSDAFTPIEKSFEDSTSPQLTLERQRSFIQLMDKFQRVKAHRKKYKSQLISANRIFIVVSTIIFGLCFGNFLFEFKKIVTSQEPMLNMNNVEYLNNITRVQESFGTERLHKNNKVLLIVLDGLRWDYTSKNPVMSGLVNDPEYSVHSKLYKISAKLPSMSVPNWLSILTGAPPEETGALGNLLIMETRYDSIFRQAKNFNVTRGLTGSPWFAEIISSNLPYLKGDGTISVSEGSEKYNRTTSIYADSLRADVMEEAIHSIPPYDLFLAHYSDIDIQGHCCGVTTDWNKDDTYNTSVAEKAEIVRLALSTVDNDTVVMFVSDHGHVDRGGHGGVDSVLLEVPLFIYKRNSYLSQSNSTSDPLSNSDVSATISALLGLPVPRECNGKFIEDAMMLVPDNWTSHHYQDLFRQKQDYLQQFLTQYGRSADDSVFQLDPTKLSTQEIKDKVDYMVNLMHDAKDSFIASETARNVLINFFIGVVIYSFLMKLVQEYTFVDVVSLFRRLKTINRVVNQKAFLIALGSIVGYYIFGISAYLLLYKAYGYSTWDSTVIHHVEVFHWYFLFSTAPATLFIYIITRIYHMSYSTFVPSRTSRLGVNRFFRRLGWMLFGFNSHYTNFKMIYLVRHYMVLVTILGSLLLFTLQGTYTFIIPSVFRIHFITTWMWQLRFQLLTVQLIALPLMGTSFLMLIILWPPLSSRVNTWDSIYALKISKDNRRQRPLDRTYLIGDEEDRGADVLDDGEPQADVHELMVLTQMDISTVTELTLTKSLNKTL